MSGAGDYYYAPDLNSLVPALEILWLSLGTEADSSQRFANVTRVAIGLSDPNPSSSVEPVMATGTTLSLETM